MLLSLVTMIQNKVCNNITALHQARISCNQTYLTYKYASNHMRWHWLKAFCCNNDLVDDYSSAKQQKISQRVYIQKCFYIFEYTLL